MSLPTSVSKVVRALQSRKQRDKLGLALIEGTRSLQSALDGGVDFRYAVVSADYRKSGDGQAQALLERVDALPNVYTVSADEFATYSEVETAQGILAAVATTWRSEADAIACSRVVALDGVQDPGNAGAIIRTAAWYGIDAVVAGAGTVDLFAPKVLRASMGGIWDLAVIRTGDLAAYLRRFVAGGGAVYAAAMEGESHISWRPARVSAVVFGNEGRGLSDDIQKLAPRPVTIARGAGGRSVESLNVSVASGILLDRWASADVGE